MDKKYYSQFNEHVYKQTLDNGMHVIINPKTNFNSVYGILTVNFGSINNIIIRDNEIINMPAGVAHFIEHKMFDKKEGDVANLFSKYGADNNAFTSFNQTSYLFSATDNVKENINILIDLVQKPYFDSKKIAKEQGIIGQEISMYQDDPSSRLYFDTIANLFPQTPLSKDIAGSKKSISKLTKDDLYDTYYQYYQPANMTLTIVGNVDVNSTMKFIDKKELSFLNTNDISLTNKLHSQVNHNLQMTQAIPQTIEKMAVSTQKVAVGYRGPQLKETDNLTKAELYLEIFLDMVFSEDSEIYQKLYSEKIINDSFGFDFNIEPGYQFIILGMDTKDAKAFSNNLNSAIEKVLKNPKILRNSFELIKNEEIGARFMIMDSIASLANEMGDISNNFTNIYDEVLIINDITFEDVLNYAQNFFENSQITTNIIHN